MHPKDRQKMCSQCDGRIPLSASFCPYCSSDQSKVTTPSQKQPPHYAPPYTTQDSMLEKKPAAVSIAIPPAESSTESVNHFFPILLLSLGSNLLTIGLLQLLFSDHGVLRLEWSSHYWFVYCLGALPLFFLGLKKLRH